MIRWMTMIAAIGAYLMSTAELSADKMNFDVKIGDSPYGITSLKCSDKPKLEFVRPGRIIGEVSLKCRTGGDWHEFKSAGKTTECNLDASKLQLSQDFKQDAGKLIWSITLKNEGSAEVEIGDLTISLPMFNDYTKNTGETFERRVFRHAFIGGEGSWVYWQPVGGGGPYLVMSALPGTALEFFTNPVTNYAFGGGEYTAYIHSAAYAETEKRGTWRQQRTSLTLKLGESKTYSFAFIWADTIPELKDAICRNGGLDVRAVPGMAVPLGQNALVGIRSESKIDSITPEFPGQTEIEAKRTKSGYTIYSIDFKKPGENLLTIERDGRKTVLEFFVTQPIETVIKKRAAFIAANQQHRDTTKWYDGLFSLWDTRQPKGKNLLGPDHLAGQYPYAVSGSDDPSNSKGVFLSEKNTVYPDPKEIEALEYYLEHFVWGKLQRTDKETPHPYGIYGCDSWHQCRNSTTGLNSGGHGQERMWRTFDYATFFTLYFNMYRIAKANPELCKYLDAKGYLERAYGTARAYYEVPYNIDMQGWDFDGWCDWAYKIGNFHEKYLVPLIDALESEGERDKAAYLRGEWEKKVRFFVCGDKYPWTSEMPVDSTAFESTYEAARYALERDLPAVKNLWKDKKTGMVYSYSAMTNKEKTSFLERQLMANVACRGWLEPSYYHRGSDFRAMGSGGYCLSYMSQMGGWAILDYGMRYAKDPADWVELGYASMLSSWALVNCGDASSNYGYWYPGKLHDGAAGWALLPQQVATEWNPATRDLPRGAWPVDGEIDHGFVAGVEGAMTVAIEDPIFGLICYGGAVTHKDGIYNIIPDDGVRQRVCLITSKRRVFVSLDNDGFAKGQPVSISADKVSISLERRLKTAHTVRVSLEGTAKDAILEINGVSTLVKRGIAEYLVK